MRTALIVPTAPLAELAARAYATNGRARSTKKAYLSDLRSFEAWCTSHGVTAIPARPELVALYATALADVGRRASTIESAVTTIAQVHHWQGVDWPRSYPAFTEVLAGIRRRLGTAPAQKAHVVDQKVVALLDAASGGLAGDRDRSPLALGGFGAFRRAERVSLDAGDVVRSEEGLVVTHRARSATQVLARRVPGAGARALAGGVRYYRGAAGSTGTGSLRRSARIRAAERVSSSAAASAPGSIWTNFRDIRCARASPLRPPSAGSRSTRSCGRRSTAGSVSRARTSGTQTSSTIMQRVVSSRRHCG